MTLADHLELFGTAFADRQVLVDGCAIEAGGSSAETEVDEHLLGQVLAESGASERRPVELLAAGIAALQVLFDPTTILVGKGAVQIPGEQLGGVVTVHHQILPQLLGHLEAMALQIAPFSKKLFPELVGFAAATQDPHP